MALSKIELAEISIAVESNGLITITSPEEILAASTSGKQIFQNESGESVIELSGLASLDQRADRSWAFAFYEEDGQSQLHYHGDRTENYYVTQGEAKVVVDGEEIMLRPGEDITIHPNQQHQVISVGTENLQMLVKCTPSWIFDDQHFINTPSKRF